MQITKTQKTEDGKNLQVTVAADAAEFEKAVNAVYKREVKKIQVPGFRAGKAPRNIIEKMYGAGVFWEDAVDDMLPAMYDMVIAAKEEETVGRPTIAVDSMDKNGVEITFTMELRPVLTVKEYKGIEAHKHTAVVTDEQVEAELNRLQDRNSRMVAVEDRAAELGDTARIYFKGYVDDTAFEGGEGDNYDLELGSGSFIPGFEEQVVGHSVGEEFDINVKFPDEYNEDLAGKDAVFHIIVRALQKKEKPAIDDEFAKDVSEFDTLDELKADILARFTKDAEERADASFENALLDKLCESAEGEVGTGLVDEYVEESFSEFQSNLKQQGIPMDMYCKYLGTDEKGLREQMRPAAEKRAKTRLVLEAVAKAENIEVSEEDVEAEFNKMAEQYQLEVEKIKELVDAEIMKKDIACTKALEVIKANGVAVECDCDDDCDCCGHDCDCDCDGDCDCDCCHDHE